MFDFVCFFRKILTVSLLDPLFDNCIDKQKDYEFVVSGTYECSKPVQRSNFLFETETGNLQNGDSPKMTVYHCKYIVKFEKFRESEQKGKTNVI